MSDDKKQAADQAEDKQKQRDPKMAARGAAYDVMAGEFGEVFAQNNCSNIHLEMTLVARQGGEEGEYMIVWKVSFWLHMGAHATGLQIVVEDLANAIPAVKKMLYQAREDIRSGNVAEAEKDKQNGKPEIWTPEGGK